MNIILVISVLISIVFAKDFNLCSDKSCNNNCTTVSSDVCIYYGNNYFIGTFVNDNTGLNLTAFSDNLCKNNKTNTPMLTIPTSGCGSFLKYYNITIGFTSNSNNIFINKRLLYGMIFFILLMYL